ncbi:Succinate dehydrogenase assembly factor 2, mitochondrial [Trichinella pseudospiralis]|uniref:Succinate dehydrogenase assembly factor 2, mitochondrial n=2 Tax=Trichinella pseudospiralis TaxID=6337 RepID=A0A0V1KD87_TRIPS|nr:Succinate dehydrogenase assembly factor 2, mitochondrial [Trichinella pseudospiralis]KRY76688.1 Succinate dehydrogenase assembly factor 2, mitochondrial [Trichinella pseudospiralis]KRY76911.1 Succinate dehydrogenase assembly factor 2, mitochondrial [Trichinella pseudospiralis]KRY93321.1 Succinate dehydrogenase assembly factor 2, mitochondrial [Trichinella pseudospiralis]KRZ34582.1 Succinate dehydrogenase assembly factor 2, mitochondrial [Trichinella pseudospiralis]
MSSLPNLLRKFYVNFRLFSSTTFYNPSKEDKNSSLETKRARLLYQSKKRGILENDLILGKFYEEHVNSLTADDLNTYDQLINGEYNEWDIYYWITGKKAIPENLESNVMQMLKSYVKRMNLQKASSF